MHNKVKDHDLVHALDTSGKLIYIEDIPIEKRGLACHCICPKCKNKVIAKLGHDVPHGKRPHFAHQKGSDCHGAEMTALHQLAEEILYEEKIVMMPEYYTIPPERKSFIRVEYEKRVDRPDLQPDIVGITSDGLRWNIEIRNTSEVKEDKINKIKKSCLTCLEIDVRGHETDKKEELKEFLINSTDNRRWINNPIYERKLNDLKLKIRTVISEVALKYKPEDGYKIMSSEYCKVSCISQNGDCIYKKDDIIIANRQFFICDNGKRQRDLECLNKSQPQQSLEEDNKLNYTLSFDEIMDDSNEYLLYNVRNKSIDDVCYNLKNQGVVRLRNGIEGEILYCDRTEHFEGIAILFRSVKIDRCSPLQIILARIDDERLQYRLINRSREKDLNSAKWKYNKLLQISDFDEDIFEYNHKEKGKMPF